MCGVGAGAGVEGRVTPKGIACLGAGAQADYVLQTPHPDATKQEAQGKAFYQMSIPCLFQLRLHTSPLYKWCQIYVTV